MHQQVNLYQPVFRKQQKVFSAMTLAQMAGAVLLMLVLILGHARWTLADLEKSADSLQTQHDQLVAQVAELEEALRTPDTEALDADIERLRANIEQRKLLLVQFEQLLVQHKGGFARQFQALAEQNLRGLWLDGVSLNSAGQVEVRGTALDAKLVPLYLQQLAKRQTLANGSFETVSMTRADSSKPQIQFVLRNQKAEMP